MLGQWQIQLLNEIFYIFPMIFCVVVCNIVQYHAIPCNTMQHHAILCNTMQNYAIPCKTMPYHALSCNTIQYHATPCNTMQCNAIPCEQSRCLTLFGNILAISEDVTINPERSNRKSLSTQRVTLPN